MNNNMNHKQGFQKKEDEFDVKKLIGRFLGYWKFYVIAIIFFVFLGLMYIRYSTPLYEVNAQVLVQEDQGASSSSFPSSDLMSDFGDLFDVQNNVYNELAILQTKDLLEKVVKEMNLNVVCYNKGDIRDVEVYQKAPFTVNFQPSVDTILATTIYLTFPQQNKDNSFTINIGDTSYTAKFGDVLNIPTGKLTLTRSGMPFQSNSYILSLNSVDAVIDAIQKNLSIDIKDKETTVIFLSYNTNVPKKGEDMLQNLITSYINRNLNEKNQISDSTIAFVNSRINIVSKELGLIETDIQHFKQSNKIADITEQSKALIDNGSTYYAKLNELDVQLSVVKTMLGYIVNESNNDRPVPALLTDDPTFLGLVQEYNNLIIQKSRVLLSVKEGNPIAQNITNQITTLRNDIVKSLQNQQKTIEIGRDRIVKENNLLGSKVYDVPAQEREYVNLSRERDVKQALYLYLLQKKEETAITKASNMSSAAIIEKPRADFLPYFPNKPVILALSVLVALIVPTGFIIFKQLFNTKVLAREDITNTTHATILAEIGHSDKQGVLSPDTEGRSVIAEQFRMFRTNMDFLIANKKPAHVLITSSMTGEGKSFIASNLGMLYAYSGKKVLLMELDLRKPKLSSMLNMPNNTGLSNYIISNKPYQDFIKPVPQKDNLFLMSSGPIPPNPAELLMSDKMRDLFAQLDEEFDIIILDTPPIGAVTDAQILSKYSDINLYVIRQYYTLKHNLDIINDLLEHERLSNLYLVVNDVKKGSSYRYGYGYSYGYGYGYTEAEKKSKKKWFGFKS
ncbi:polysaccharide biosynthesis tyrosine autokinase [Panacibacter ginsenosidivorans]|uniref:non-specific protein-tyrosine kinase n=1 Tax=Panacibacter ginsenosidivorans TaxID=1813871 RepID=A0A5B8VE61_9BACT|nr:tyrosine-protein kinase [Panacibacter ginsenosidivorans]QEC68558.1 polysaccharide biosynthesis tyrosine autokinase [Panacibacter ginsenosidivorans]